MGIEAVKNNHEEQLMQLPNVIGVGIGKKAGKKVIKVLVTRKVPEPLLRPEETIPKTIDGYETDVEEIGEVRILT